ncbi:MAG: pyruvate, water dikinase [Desulfobacteraceae bacterium]|nr:MAG: pyruvate, water dikinase [Desulfobacteraceae bacterium]
MERLRALYSRFRNRARQQPTKAEAEALRIAFKERYHQFKLILSANNKALDLMAEIERALQGTTPFGMQFVRSRCTRISTSVFQIVQHINALAPGKYAVLFQVFKQVQKRINPFVHLPAPDTKGPLVMPLATVDKTSADLVGPKLANLAELAAQLGLRIPDGFVITSSGFESFMGAGDLQAEINRRIQSAEIERSDQMFALSAAIQNVVIQSAVPQILEEKIMAELQRMEAAAGKPLRLAVRSSALGEDLAGTSFAGQYRSVLNVGKEALTAAYKEVVASAYGLTAMTYRRNRGIPDEDVVMCVGCLQMADATAGGVLYTRNPMDIRDETMLIHANWGLPKSVVDGTTDTDRFVIRRDRPPHIQTKQIPRKAQQYVCYPEEGVCRMALTGSQSEHPCLSDAQALALAQLGLRIETFYGVPQDIEWVLDDQGQFIILQCRPLQQFEPPAVAPPDSRRPACLSGGQTASPGVGSGNVFIVTKAADALQFPEGAVLVTTQALPRWAALLDRAAAVITEQGSPAGHLANVAREFSVPALVGMAGATTALRMGQCVTVDAGGRKIYDGRIEALLAHADQPRNLMAGSRVWQLLEGAAGHIVPLHLLNPEGPEFKAERCRTFHDITRYCHEKAVAEMFRFGKDHYFPERSSKQLRAQIPMQWWVLNLDDGFQTEVEGPFVELDNILSIPMLALWSGITAFPWQGPPPMDGKGFISVMFQATANQALLPTVRSSMANRNYFMISRNYCSLQSRLGFHFSIVETLVGDRTGENYINFHFKGGGADFSRRLKRVLFIKEILEPCGFHIRIQQDALNARAEQSDRNTMVRLLKVLGYILIHTRQLDMIMANTALLNRYRNKIRSDIDTFLNPGAARQKPAGAPS